MPALYDDLCLLPCCLFVWLIKLSYSSFKFSLYLRFVYVKVIFLTVLIWFPQLCIVLILQIFASQSSEPQRQ